MSTYNSEGAQDLTEDELILHHHAAVIKRDLEAYHMRSKSKEDWVNIFTNHLAHFIPVFYFYNPFLHLSRPSR